MVHTIKSLLQLEELNGLQVVSGFQGTDRQVKNTLYVDNPDFFDLLSDGDIVVTTGYPFYVLKDDSDFQVNTIKTLVKNNCSALVIKSSKYFDDMPKFLIQFGELLNFPIIEVPGHLSLAKIEGLIKQKLGVDQESLLVKTIDVQNRLMRATFKGLDYIIKETEKMIDYSITLLDQDYKYLGGLRPDFIHSKTVTSKIFNKIEELPAEFLINEKFVYVNDIPDLKQLGTCAVFPINDSIKIYGYLILWESPEELSDISQMIIERACSIIALDVSKNTEIKKKREKIKAEFFEDLLINNVFDQKKITNLASYHGIQATVNYYCVVVKATPLNDQSKHQADHKYKTVDIERYLQAIYLLIEEAELNAVKALLADQIVLFLPVEHHLNTSESLAVVDEFINALSEIFSKSTVNSFSYNIAVGSMCSDLRSFSKSHRDAVNALEISKKVDPKATTTNIKDYKVYEFLKTNIDTKALRDFSQSIIGKLVNYDYDNHTEYITILDTYISNMGNISVTAREVFLHRNTLIHKLDIISDILDIDLKDAETILELSLALKINKLI